MDKFVLFTSSACDLDREFFEKNDVKFISFNVTLDDKDIKDDVWKTYTPKEFFDLIRAGKTPKTSQINVNEYIEAFKPYLEEGYDIIHIELSSGITGSVNSLNLAINELKEIYPDRKVYGVDSLCGSSGFGLLVDRAVELRDEGKSAKEIYEELEDTKLNIQHWFTSEDLTHYFRGGRISKVSYVIGGALNICPVIHVDEKGRLIPKKKVRGFKKALNTLISQMEELCENREDYDRKVFICHSDDIDSANYLKAEIEKKFKKCKGVYIYSIGMTVGSHTGPGTLSVFFWGDKRA